jgi:hypothetical protein
VDCLAGSVTLMQTESISASADATALESASRGFERDGCISIQLAPRNVRQAFCRAVVSRIRRVLRRVNTNTVTSSLSEVAAERSNRQVQFKLPARCRTERELRSKAELIGMYADLL